MNIKNTIFFLAPNEFARYETLARNLAEADFGVPPRYRGNFGNCLNAVDIAYRLGVSPLVVLQNTRETDDGPTWGYQFVKVLIEMSGRIEGELEYEFEGEQGKENYRARASAKHVDGRRLNGIWVTWQMASLEGWTDNISYTSMPEVMFRARATTFFGNQFFPSLLLGMTVDTAPLEDGGGAASPGPAAPAPIGAIAPAPLEQPSVPPGPAPSALEQALAQTPTAQPPAPTPGPTHAPTPAPTTAPVDPVVASSPPPAKEPSSTKPKRGAGARAERAATGAEAPAPSEPQQASVAPPPQLVEAGRPGAAPTERESAPVNEASGSPASSLPGLDADQQFSQAFATVDATERTAESLTESMEIIDGFQDITEKSDLYLILLGVVEKHLVSMANGASTPSRAELDFAKLVHNLHLVTKVYAESSKELAEKRKSMGAAYTNLGAQMQKRSQKAS